MVRGVWDGLTSCLEGEIVVLEPLQAGHREGLLEAARPPEIWEWLPHIATSVESFDSWFEWSLKVSSRGEAGVFATVDRASGDPVGSTRYMELRPEHHALEIGFTWLTPSMWRTGANVEAKLLMLQHAFDRLGCVRVEFKTDTRNHRSRTAMEALPAQFEGVLRSHMTVPGVGLRDSAYYSVIQPEWQEVRSNLQRRLRERDTG